MTRLLLKGGFEVSSPPLFTPVRDDRIRHSQARVERVGVGMVVT